MPESDQQTAATAPVEKTVEVRWRDGHVSVYRQIARVWLVSESAGDFAPLEATEGASIYLCAEAVAGVMVS